MCICVYVYIDNNNNGNDNISDSSHSNDSMLVIHTTTIHIAILATAQGHSSGSPIDGQDTMCCRHDYKYQCIII